MRAVARVFALFALLALVAVGFCTTVRLCGPSDARAGELPRVKNDGPLVTAVLGAPEHVTADGLPAGSEEMWTRYERPDTPRENDGAPDDGASANADSGGLELHDLSVWDSPNDRYVYLSFAPISMETFFGEVPFRNAVVEGEEVSVADVAPVLDEAHVGVELDGKSAVVSSLQWYYAGYGDLGGADVKYMPVCLIRVERPELSSGEHSLRVRIEDVGTGETGAGIATFACSARSSEL